MTGQVLNHPPCSNAVPWLRFFYAGTARPFGGPALLRAFITSGREGGTEPLCGWDKSEVLAFREVTLSSWLPGPSLGNLFSK